MDNFTEPTNSSDVNDVQSEDELGHSDKMIGVFSEPTSTYEKIAKYPTKTIDWFLPVLIAFLVIAVTQILINSNKAIHSQIVEMQMSKMQKNLDKAVAEKKITQDQETQQLNAMQDRMENFGVLQMVFIVVGIFIGGFIVFFIISGIYYLFVKFLLKGDGNFNSVLVASGLTFYIAVIQVLISTILTFALGRYLQDTSLASFFDSDKSTFLGFIFSKLDIFSIWIYIVLSIGLAKMFKSNSTGKYYATVFGIWLIGGLILFFIGKAVPILGAFGG